MGITNAFKYQQFFSLLEIEKLHAFPKELELENHWKSLTVILKIIDKFVYSGFIVSLLGQFG